MEKNTERNAGLIHLYIGNGKGKTTAAAGLSVRAMGRGKMVVFTQFLKTGETGEIHSLEKLGAKIIRGNRNFGWIKDMSAETKALCREEERRLLTETAQFSLGAGLIVLDEALDALNAGFLDDKDIRTFIERKAGETELVITGRNPPEWILEAADYVSEIKKIKHPYDRGIKARIGIEK
ncbi:MAG: cob(I)yrinic acid a,c-diamide adenosyltransferase [Spirochaetaceae bacterium]|jgi:cob(I)alamin adenosyltransferase|nr:cob(I)yrinic acid a,c-diamide adenosyltransferase [Spirochaetaceae bacterium]